MTHYEDFASRLIIITAMNPFPMQIFPPVSANAIAEHLGNVYKEGF
jgi:hypothetical protein